MSENKQNIEQGTHSEQHEQSDEEKNQAKSENIEQEENIEQKEGDDTDESIYRDKFAYNDRTVDECFTFLPAYEQIPNNFDNNDFYEQINKVIYESLEGFNLESNIFVSCSELYSEQVGAALANINIVNNDLPNNCCDLESDSSLYDENPNTFAKALEHEGILQESVFLMNLQSNINKRFIERLFFSTTYQQISKNLKAKRSTLIICISIQRQQCSRLINRIRKTNSAVLPIDWLLLCCIEWQELFEVEEQEIKVLYENIKGYIEQHPQLEVWLASELIKIKSILPNDVDSDKPPTVRDIDNKWQQIVKDKKPLNDRIDATLAQKLNDGWERYLQNYLFGLFSVLSEHPPVSYRQLYFIGEKLLDNEQIYSPLPLKEIRKNILNNNQELKSQRIDTESQYIEQPATILWHNNLDRLLKENNFRLVRKKNTIGPCIEAITTFWPAGYLENQVILQYPSIILNIKNEILERNLLIPPFDLDNDIANANISIFARLTTSIVKIDNGYMEIETNLSSGQLAEYEHLINRVLHQAENHIANYRNIENRLTIKLLFSRLALTIAHLLNAILQQNLLSSDIRLLFNNLVKISLQRYEKARVLVEAMGMISENGDFDIYPYLFDVLMHEWSEKNSPARTNLWFTVRKELAYQMKQSLTVRLKILNSLFEQMQTVKAKKIQEITLARLWFDAFRADVNHQKYPANFTFSHLLLNDENNGLQGLIKEFNSFPAEDIYSGNINESKMYDVTSKLLLSGVFNFEEEYEVNLHRKFVNLIKEKIEKHFDTQLEKSLGNKFKAELKNILEKNNDLVIINIKVKELSLEYTEHNILQVYPMFRFVALAELPLRAFGFKSNDPEQNKYRNKGIENYLRCILKEVKDKKLDKLINGWSTLFRWFEECSKLPSQYNKGPLNEKTKSDIEHKLMSKCETVSRMIEWLEKNKGK